MEAAAGVAVVAAAAGASASAKKPPCLPARKRKQNLPPNLRPTRTVPIWKALPINLLHGARLRLLLHLIFQRKTVAEISEESGEGATTAMIAATVADGTVISAGFHADLPLRHRFTA